MNDILKYDKNFSESLFKTFVDNVFIQIHLALMTQDLERVKHFVSNEVFKKYNDKLQILQSKNLRQMYDEINVKQTTILSTDIVDNYMVIKVNITSRYMDYLIDNEGNFVSGINSYRVEKENYLTFVKRIDVIGNDSIKKCPNCGSAMDINSNGKCSYCRTIYNMEDKDWVLTDIETR